MKFSVITISYNHAEFIEKTITSVLDQNYPDFEHIIIDGASTDNSVEIFKKYPHLNWVSEKDSGLSNALTKGMKKATGDIIAWINSDDFYLPGAFQAVADAMKGHDIVLGDSNESDRQGNPLKLISNVGRTLCDLEKYWVPKAWLSQPSVFFSRSALESVKLANGDYLDETFKYSMDFDLWLRLGEKYSFLNYIAKPLSNFRVYGDNLTGKTFASPQRELGRAFRKSYARRFPSERPQEIIIPITKLNNEFGALLDQLFQQDLQDFQITIVDALQSSEESKLLKEVIQQTEESTTLITLRYQRAAGASLFEAISKGLADAVCGIVSVLPSHASVSKEFTAKILNIFAHDVYGAAALIPASEKEALTQIIDPVSGLANLNGILSSQFEFIPFAIRRGVLNEIKPQGAENAFSFIASILLSTIAKGWLIPVESNTGLNVALHSRDPEIHDLFTPYQRAELFKKVFELGIDEPFHPFRVESGYAPQLDEKTYKSISNFLSQNPSNWFEFSIETTEENLKITSNQYPQFAPGWYLLAKKLHQAGSTSAAQELFSLFKKLRPESQLTL